MRLWDLMRFYPNFIDWEALDVSVNEMSKK